MDKNQKPKICLIFAGGTIAMAKDKKTGALKPGLSEADILKKVPEISRIAEIDTVFVTDIDSTNMTPDIWNEISKAIYERMDDYDGFVVTHGTDTIAYTASAVSFQLQNLPKPIIFTGSQLSLDDETRSEARSNLVFAIQYASMDIAEVAIFFGTSLVRANRSHKASQFDFEAIRSYNYPLLGKAGIRPQLFPYRHKRSEKKVKFYPIVNSEGKNKKVHALKFFPGMKPDILEYLINLGVEGIVIEGAGPGNLPTNSDYSSAIRKAKERKIPIVINTQCEIGSAELHTYEVGKAVEDAGGISGKDMTTEAAFTKLMWALENFDNYEKVVKIMEENVAGELSDEYVGYDNN